MLKLPLLTNIFRDPKDTSLTTDASDMNDTDLIANTDESKDTPIQGPFFLSTVTAQRWKHTRTLKTPIRSKNASIAFVDNTKLISAIEAEIFAWNIDTGCELWHVEEYEERGKLLPAGIHDITIEDTRIFYGGLDGNISVRNALDGTWIGHVGPKTSDTNSSSIIGSLAFRPCSDHLACGRLYSIDIWEFHSRPEYQSHKHPLKLANSLKGSYIVVWSPDGLTLASANDNKVILNKLDAESDDYDKSDEDRYNVYLSRDPSTGKKTRYSIENDPNRVELLGHRGNIRSMAFSPNGELLASVGVGNPVDEAFGDFILWDLNTQQKLQTIGTKDYYSVAWSPNGHTFAVAAKDAVELYEAHTGVLIETLSGNNEFVNIAFSPNGHRLAIVNVGEGKEGNIYIWDRVDVLSVTGDPH